MEAQNGPAANVYVLQVRSFDLPVCKFGVTKKVRWFAALKSTKASTGDFTVAGANGASGCHSPLLRFSRES